MGVAPVRGLSSCLGRHILEARGGGLALLQALHVGVGAAGQLLLLTRWSPHSQTDLFLLLGVVPWLVSAAVLVGGLDTALPAAYHRALASGGEAGVRRFVGQVATLSLLLAGGAALAGGAVVAGWAMGAGLGVGAGLWMGLALGGQVLPAALAALWRGVLVARNRLIRERLALLAGSLLTAIGYALLPYPPALSLPLVTLGATMLLSTLAWAFCRPVTGIRGLRRLRPLHPEVKPLVSALAALGAAAGLVHARSILLRTAVVSLGMGWVAALTVAERHWDAVLAIIVAASVAPVFPRWAEGQARGRLERSRQLLRRSLAATLALSLAAAGVFAAVALVFPPVLERELGWRVGAQALRAVLALLPRFVLLACVQPLVMKNYAQGTPWHPVLGAALDVGAVGLGALVLIPRLGLPGVALATAAGVVPGLLYLGWREGWEARRCAS